MSAKKRSTVRPTRKLAKAAKKVVKGKPKAGTRAKRKAAPVFHLVDAAAPTQVSDDGRSRTLAPEVVTSCCDKPASTVGAITTDPKMEGVKWCPSLKRSA